MPREWYAAGAKKMPPQRMGFGLPGAPAQKKKKQKENAVKGTRKRGLFEKSPLLTPAKTFQQLTPDIGREHPKQRVSLKAPPQAAQVDQNISKIFAASTTHTSATG